LSSVKSFMNAGEQVTLPVVREFLRATAPFGVRERAMQPSFGMAEVCTCMTYQTRYSEATGVRRVLKSSLGGQLQLIDREDERAAAFIDLGPPIPGIQIRIADEGGRALPEGRIGRFQIRGTSVTPGYFRNDQANDEAFAGDGWFDSGDLGFLLDGRLTLTGRAKETIIVRGANFYCYEIEDVVNRVKGVEPTWAAACAVGDAGSGTEGVAVFYVPRGAGSDPVIDAQQLKAIRAEVTSNLGLSPQYVIPIGRDQFPKTTSGKIQRTRLKERLDAGEYDGLVKRIDLALENANTLPSWFFRKVWRPREVLKASYLSGQTVLILLDADGLGRGLSERLRRAGVRAVEVETGHEFMRVSADAFRVDPRSVISWSRVFDAAMPVACVLDLSDLQAFRTSNHAVQDSVARATSLLTIIRALATSRSARGDDDAVRFLVACGSETSDDQGFGRTQLAALLRTLAFELPWLNTRQVELPAMNRERALERMSSELTDLSSEREVKYRGDGRFVPRLERLDVETPAPPIASDRLYAISGGSGGIGTLLARRLASDYRARLLLIGRSSPETVADAITSLEAFHDRIHYAPVDICDREALESEVARAERLFGSPLAGVFHLAGTYHERLLLDEMAAGLEDALRPKLLGGLNLARLLQDRGGGLFVAFSSLNGSFGGFGVGAYSAASRSLEELCDQLRQAGLRSYCLEWSLWHQVGMSGGRDSAGAAAARGYLSISPERGVTSCLAMLRRAPGHHLIGLDSSRPAVRRLLDRESEPVQILASYYEGEPGLVAGEPIADRFGTESRCELVALPELPRDAAGRLDPGRLTQTGLTPRGTVHEEPRGEIEERLAAIWREVLTISRLGRHDDFFELGGHSLAATQVVARLGAAFGVDLSVSDLFSARTLARCAERIDTLRWAAADPVGASSFDDGLREHGEI
jgi:NAD(P)-dependent dehydrogenase (short-subunit alcohol dehydrogenase family)